MAMTLTYVDRSTHGKLHETFWKVTFGSNDYVTGGYAIVPNQVGLGNIISGDVISISGSGSSLCRLYWDGTTTPVSGLSSGKLMALRSISNTPPPVIIEESVTMTANAGQLARIPAYIMACHQQAGSVTGGSTIVPTGSTLATKQTDVNWKTGAVKTLAADAVTTLFVTYIPLGCGPFIEANRVIDEAVTLPNATTVNLANQACLVQYVYDTTSAIPLPVVGTTNLPGSGQIQIALQSGGNTIITDNAAQNAHAAKATYWKFTPFGTQFGVTTGASVNASSNSIKHASAIAVGGIIIPAYGVHHAAYATNTDVPSIAIGPSGTAATATPTYDPAHNLITFVAGDNITREFYGYLIMADELLTWSSELPANSNLSSMTAFIRFFGTK